MKAITIVPGQARSARLQEVAEPPASDGDILVRTLALGICGTDLELVAGDYGSAPQGSDTLILGHESLGVVEEARDESGFAKGDIVVGIVRRPDPVPCIACAVEQWDMCRNGQYTERGIKERNGFGAERFRNESAFTVKIEASLTDVGVLMEPASVLAKAWDHISRIGLRAEWKPKTVLVTGAGPIGLLAALMGKLRGLEVHVFDKIDGGSKPQLVHELGAEYHVGDLDALALEPDVIIECTGAAPLINGVLKKIKGAGILCLAGVSSQEKNVTLDLGELNRRLVLENGVIFGSVNANRHHYDLAHDALVQGDRGWLNKLITRRVPLSNWSEALKREPNDIKVIIEFPKT